MAALLRRVYRLFTSARNRGAAAAMASSSPSSKSAATIADFDKFSAQLQRALLSTARIANGVPGPSDLSYQRTLSRPTGKKIDQVSQRLLHITSSMLVQARQATEHIGSKDSKGKGKSKAILEHEDVVDRYEANVVAVTDHLLELMDTNLDQHSRALTKAAQPLAATSAPVASTSKPPPLSSELRHSSNLAKPQLQFTFNHSNARGAVFEPLIESKLHATAPLDISAVLFQDEKTGEERMRIPNPYEREIGEAVGYPLPSLAPRPPDAELGQMESAMDSKPFTFVDTVEGLRTCLAELKKADTIAVDLEHHDHRSYRGFTCLIQVSQSALILITSLMP